MASHRNLRAITLVAIALGTWSPLVPFEAEADPIRVIGASLVVDNPGSPIPVIVQATFLGDATALYDNELFLDAPSFLGPIFNNHVTPVGVTTSLGTFLPETVLFIRNQAFLAPPPGSPASYNFGFFTGTGALPPNPDGLPHAVFSFDPADSDVPVTVAFEDQFGGGDLDFNDALYSFTNVRAQLVQNALAPLLIPVGSTVTVAENETKSMANFDDFFDNEGSIDNGGLIFNYGSTSNTGTLDNPGTVFNDLTGELFNGDGGLIQNSGAIRSFGVFENDGGEIASSGELINGGGTLSNLAGTLVNSGLLDNVVGNIGNGIGGALDNLGTFLNSGTLDNAGTLENSGSLENNGGAIVNSGILDNALGNIGNGIGGALDNLGTFLNSGTLDNAGTLENSGSLENNGGAIVNSGILDNALGNIGNGIGGALDNLGTFLNSGTVDNAGSITNSGSVVVTSGGSVSGTGTYTQTGGSTQIDGVLQSAISSIEGGIVSGVGVVNGFLTVSGGAGVSPGNSPGTLNVTGDFTLDDGFLDIELAGTSEHDLLAITGQAVFSAGTVNYDFAFTPSDGDSFVFLIADGGIAGAENLAFNVLGPVDGLSFKTEVEGNSLVLRVTVDACPDDDDKTEPGICGCGVSDVDTDGDAAADCNDGCPQDAGKTTPGICGCGVSDADTDSDSVADCRDNCPTVPNADQADTNGNGVGDACEAPASGETTICADLSGFLDVDSYVFDGAKGETVDVVLRAEPPRSTQKYGLLALDDRIPGVSLLRTDTGKLPNSVQAKLPKAGRYGVTVASFGPSVVAFKGAYCITLRSSGPAATTLR